MKNNIFLLALALVALSPAFAIQDSAEVSKTEKVSSPVQVQELALNTVQKNIRVGSTQDEISKAIGTPTIVTRDSKGIDTWVYNKASSISSYDSSGFELGIILAGFAKTKENAIRTQKNLMVIIKFDEDKKAKSFSYQMEKL